MNDSDWFNISKKKLCSKYWISGLIGRLLELRIRLIIMKDANTNNYLLSDVSESYF